LVNSSGYYALNRDLCHCIPFVYVLGFLQAVALSSCCTDTFLISNAHKRFICTCFRISCSIIHINLRKSEHRDCTHFIEFNNSAWLALQDTRILANAIVAISSTASRFQKEDTVQPNRERRMVAFDIFSAALQTILGSREELLLLSKLFNNPM